jgi:hypothetical protein
MSSVNGQLSPLHRVYPPVTDDTGTENGTGERAVTGGEAALAAANAGTALAEARPFDFKSMLEDIRDQRDRWQQQAERLHSRLRISGRSPHPHGLSPGGECSASPQVTSCFYGLWASFVGAF